MELNQTTRKKLLLSILVVMVGILSYLSVIDAVFQKTFLRELDESGGRYLDETMSRSIYTFAIVRGINGVISVIQGTSVAVSPAGVGVQLALGEIFDPVNDLVERFSWVMLASSTSLGIQKILMEMGTWFGFKILLSFSMLIMFIGIWAAQYSNINWVSSGYKLILVSVMIRFCIPAVAIASEKVYDLFLKDRYAESIQSLEKVSQEIKDATLVEAADESSTGDPGYLDTLKQLYNNTKDIVGIKAKILFLKDKLSDYAKYTVNLIIVFMLQTVIIPIFVLWAMVRFVSYLCGTNFISHLKDANCVKGG